MGVPCCPKCESTRILSKERSFSGINGIIIYCADCSSILAWTPHEVKNVNL